MARKKIDCSPFHDHFRSYSCRSRRPVLVCLACPTSDDRRSVRCRSVYAFDRGVLAKSRAHERGSQISGVLRDCASAYASIPGRRVRKPIAAQATGRRIQPEKTHTRERCLITTAVYALFAYFAR